jgi:hypothetical protein
VCDLRDRRQIHVDCERADGTERTQDQDDQQVVAPGWVQSMLIEIAYQARFYVTGTLPVNIDR